MFIEKSNESLPDVFSVSAAVYLGAGIVEEDLISAFVDSHFAFIAILPERGVEEVHFFNRDRLVVLGANESAATAMKPSSAKRCAISSICETWGAENITRSQNARKPPLSCNFLARLFDMGKEKPIRGRLDFVHAPRM
jgi:hypothetical protein